MTINQLPPLSSPDGKMKVPVSLNGADYGIEIRNIIITEEGGDTTSSAGNCSLGISNDYVVLAVWRTDALSICIPYMSINNNEWWVHVISTTGTAVANTSIDFAVVYMPKINMT